jgi:hypothetical protein
MLRFITILPLMLITVLISKISIMGGMVEHTYEFEDYTITKNNGYHILQFQNTQLKGKLGEPALPYFPVKLVLPPGEIAVKTEFIGDNEILIPQKLKISPRQYPKRLGSTKGTPFSVNPLIYSGSSSFRVLRKGELRTGYMNGFAIAITSFTPVNYNPATGATSFFQRVMIRITTKKSEISRKKLLFLHPSCEIQSKVQSIIDNKNGLGGYQLPQVKRNNYDLIIITKKEFAHDFKPLTEMHAEFKITSRIATIEDISLKSGKDMQEKIRNYIIDQYKNNKIKYVLLGGDVEHVPHRGFYAKVKSSMTFEINDSPADLYYSGLDGTWNDNGNSRWGEKGEDDLEPDVAVGRLPFSSSEELRNCINKIISYMTEPVFNELTQHLMVSEYVYDNPVTWGSQYLELLIGDHNENGYTTTGIPKYGNDIRKLYDRDAVWNRSKLLAEINKGPSFIHHCGHAEFNKVMRLQSGDIIPDNFKEVDGVKHNFPIVYTHGCICGAFEQNDCIGEKMVTLENFAAAFLGNSREGWFIEGTTDGASIHMHREFISALYSKKTDRIGEALLIAKAKTRTFVDLPDEYEPGAMRWNFYCLNLLGDPAMIVRIANTPSAIDDNTGSYEGKNQINLTVSKNIHKQGLNITYFSHGDSKVDISIFSSNGQIIKTISSYKTVKGFQTVYWDGKNSLGKKVGNGFYLIQCCYKNNKIVRNICILK